MHREFWGEDPCGAVYSDSSFLGGMDKDTALILSVMLLIKKQGGHDILLPALLYILM